MYQHVKLVLNHLSQLYQKYHTRDYLRCIRSGTVKVPKYTEQNSSSLASNKNARYKRQYHKKENIVCPSSSPFYWLEHLLTLSISGTSYGRSCGILDRKSRNPSRLNSVCWRKGRPSCFLSDLQHSRSF